MNDGAVRLEVLQASGLSQISPEQFPESDATARFAPRATSVLPTGFPSADFALRIQADQILPEVGVSEVLAYHLGENELAVDAEIELDIREAPLRELLLHVPKGYAVAQLTAPGLSDYFTARTAETSRTRNCGWSMASPFPAGRWCNCAWNATRRWARRTGRCRASKWRKAKSVRGFVGVSADAGFRLTPGTHAGADGNRHGLFPEQARRHPGGVPAERPGLAGDDARRAAAADGPGGCVSSVLHRRRHRLRQQRDQLRGQSGAPVSAFKRRVVGRIFQRRVHRQRHPQLAEDHGGYVVQLHTPVSGAYTLLATYERPFKPQGETLAFTGARPLDAQSEQGYTLVISAYQFQVKPADVSPGLLRSNPAKCRPNTACSSTRRCWRPTVMRRARSI